MGYNGKRIYRMDIQEYMERLRRVTSEFADKARERSILLSANELLGTIKNRIQLKNEDSQGAKMKIYSTTPIYVKRDAFVVKSAFKPKNQRSKTMYFEHGYKQFRAVQGRQAQVWDLHLSGDLMKSYVIGQTDESVQIGFDSRDEIKKKESLEKMNEGNIFQSTKEEMEKYKYNVLKQQIELIDKIFK